MRAQRLARFWKRAAEFPISPELTPYYQTTHAGPDATKISLAQPVKASIGAQPSNYDRTANLPLRVCIDAERV